MYTQNNIINIIMYWIYFCKYSELNVPIKIRLVLVKKNRNIKRTEQQFLNLYSRTERVKFTSYFIQTKGFFFKRCVDGVF